jgi:hypothetical protein
VNSISRQAGCFVGTTCLQFKTCQYWKIQTACAYSGFALIFALMDRGADGTVSLEEFQAAHERIFKAMDADKDGIARFHAGTG